MQRRYGNCARVESLRARGEATRQGEMNMPITYTNRKGFTYYLCQGITKTGKARYYFAREPKDEPVKQVPSGYQIDESVNGIVSLVKARPRLVLPQELVSVESALKKHPKGRNYRVAIKHDQIVIYEGLGPDLKSLSAIFGAEMIRQPEIAGRLQVEMDRYTQYTPVMRFILEDAEGRIFVAQRWCYRGSIDDWIYAGHSGKIEVLAKKLVPKLGTDDFYELY